MSTLHSILEHAVRLGEIEKNPARGIRRIASTPKMRWLSHAELRKLGSAMRDAEDKLEHPKGLAVIQLLLLTGFRRLEALSLERKWRSEEHTSELQSLMRISYAVFCLQKKNNNLVILILIEKIHSISLYNNYNTIENHNT